MAIATAPYSRLAEIYDALYEGMGKDYRQESETLHRLILQYKQSAGNHLLDVACGTGGHLAFLREQYTVEGLDLSGDMLAIARGRFPEVPLHKASMVEFDLGRRFDAAICLFSAIGYVGTVERLGQAVSTMARHLQPGGVLIIEPWLLPEVYRPGTVHATFVNQPELKIARMTISEVYGRLAVNDMHYLVATSQRIEHFTDRHELALFTHNEYIGAIHASGLQAIHDPQGLTGRGLYIGVKPLGDGTP